MSRREEEEEEVTTAVYMAAIARAEEEDEGKEVLTAKMSTKKEVNVKSLEGNRLRRMSIEADKLKNATAPQKIQFSNSAETPFHWLKRLMAFNQWDERRPRRIRNCGIRYSQIM